MAPGRERTGQTIPELGHSSESPTPRTWNLLLSPIARGVVLGRLHLGAGHQEGRDHL